MCKNWLRKKICSTDIPKPSGLEDIDINEIYSLLFSQFPDAQLLLSDKNYKTTNKEELEKYLKYDLTDIDTYENEYYDCDDFSFSLMGGISNPIWGSLSFGIIWVKKDNNSFHALNIFIDSDRRIWMVEPQNDKIFEFPDNWATVLVII
jgi:hypothetical protein